VWRKAVTAVAVMATMAGAVLASTTAPPALAAGAPAAGASAAGASGSLDHRACAAPTALRATCFSVYRAVSETASRSAASSPATPADIRAAYHLSASAGAGQVVGIVDAQDDPKAESDLAKFRSTNGLPPCTTANGCFRKVNQRGQAKPLPQGDEGWGLEISLDLDAVSSACPACNILLVEGDSPELSDLGLAVNTAVRLGAKVVSNSYGTTEFGGMAAYGHKYYTHSSVPIVVSSGDDSFGPAQFPAVLDNVIAVGGTSLRRAAGTTRGWNEKVWDGAGSGCSAYIAKPTWQKDTHCLMRTVADVSADADPATGLLVRDSYGFPGVVQVGGTSLSAPLIAAMIAAAGNTTSVHNASGLYAHPRAFNDVVEGSNGFCGGDYLCTGRPGYDAPTGVGTPAGTGGL
jgi:subtilase family serine protease